MLILKRNPQERLSLFRRSTGEHLGDVVNVNGFGLKLGLDFGPDVHIVRTELLDEDDRDDQPSEAA